MDVVCAGEVMLEFAPTGANGAYQRAFAGDSFNTAVYLARAGLKTRYLTRLGDDAASQSVLEMMDSEGVGHTAVAQEAGSSMGLYLIDNDASGERSFSYYRDASPARRLFDTPISLTADVFYFTGITLAVTRSGQGNLLALLNTLRVAGTRIVFDPNFRPRLWEDLDQARNYILSVLPYCDLVLPTLDDDTSLWGLETAGASIDFYREQGADEVVVKGDDLLVEAWSEAGCASRKAEPVDAVDTTGAGDAFNAAYLATRLGGGDLMTSLSAGQTLAAQVVQHAGAIVPRHYEARVPRSGER